MKPVRKDPAVPQRTEAESVDEEESSPRPNYPIESVDNALRLLLLIEARGQIRVSEVSAELGTAVSTAHRLLAMLQHYSFVRQDPRSRVYEAGPVLVRLGLNAVRNMDIRLLVRPYLEKLRDEVGETVHIAIPQGNEVLFIDSAESRKALRVSSRVGMAMWAHCTSIGKAYLACEDNEHLIELYPSIELPGITRYSITSRSRLLAELDEVRKVGYAKSTNESEEGVGSVGVVIRDHDRRPVACLSIAVPLSRLTAETESQIVEAALNTVAAIELILP